MAAGSSAASGSPEVSLPPKAVITNGGGLFGVQKGGYLVNTSVCAENSGVARNWNLRLPEEKFKNRPNEPVNSLKTNEACFGNPSTY